MEAPQEVSVAQFVGRVMLAEGASQSDPLYRFDGEPDILRGAYEHPAVFGAPGQRFSWSLERRERRALLCFGPANSGAAFHKHTAAFNALFYGSKRWFLFPPAVRTLERDGAHDMPMPAWFERVHPTLPLAPIEYIQQPGEVLFVPEAWSHGVINLEAAVGVAVELGSDVHLGNQDTSQQGLPKI